MLVRESSPESPLLAILEAYDAGRRNPPGAGDAPRPLGPAPKGSMAAGALSSSKRLRRDLGAAR